MLYDVDISKKLRGLDLFTGIGGITLALKDYVHPIAYCEIDSYSQSILLQRMSEGNLPKAPIWDDIRTMSPLDLPHIDIIYGGFPCQDISVAGNGKGLEGERSGLFFEIIRLSKEIKPSFIFLENVPAITTRGGIRVVREIAEMGYDCRWCIISAASVGALHRRERWFLLAHTKREGLERQWGSTERDDETHAESTLQSKDDRNTKSITSGEIDTSANGNRESRRGDPGKYWPFESRVHWQEVVNSVCRVSDGLPFHVDRLKALGNSVVPQQVKKAFEILMGISTD
jgi:DNA (cytosine-5)-methyltransferase 1